MKTEMNKKGLIRRIMVVSMTAIMSLSFGGTGADCFYDEIITEEHLATIAYADGIYSGEGSDSEVGGESSVDVSLPKRSYNILEIVPDIRSRLIGYAISGQEPFDSYTLDALVNSTTGIYKPDSPNDPVTVSTVNNVKLSDIDMNRGSEPSSFFYADLFNGYYEKVGDGEGVYALKSKPSGNFVESESGDVFVKNVYMVSKFAGYSGDLATGYNYRWVEDPSLKSFDDESAIHKTKLENVTSAEKIYVYNHKKNKYVHNETFLCGMCDFCPGIINPMKGIYDGLGSNGTATYKDNMKKTSNYDVVAKWKESNRIKVVSREPGDVTYADVEDADFIVISSTVSDGAYNKAFNLFCGITNDSNAKKLFSESNDLKADIVKRIYYHVVVKEDTMIVCSTTTANGTSSFNTNVGRLCAMLFYVNNKENDKNLSDGEAKAGTGRDFFRNLLDDYGYDIESRAIQSNNDLANFGTTDLIRINNIDDTLSPYVNNSYRSWSSDPINAQIKYALNGYNFSHNWLFNDDLKNYYGDYYVIDSFNSGRYRNQMFYNEWDTLFMLDKYGNGLGPQLRKMSQNTTHIEHTSDEEGDVKEKIKYYLSLNILNGDSVSKELKKENEVVTNLNKTMYINRYEIKNMPTNYVIPLDVVITTSHKIKSITVKKKDNSKSTTFSGTNPVLTGKLGALTLKEDTSRYVDGNPKHVTGEDKDYYMYILEEEQKVNGEKKDGIAIPKDWFDRGTNNTVIVEVENELGGKMSDTITFVTRDFFLLN